MKNRIFAFLCCILLIAFPLETQAATDIDVYISNIIEFKSGEEEIDDWISGELAQNAGISSEWYAIGLSRCCTAELSPYADALEHYLSEQTVTSAVTRQRCALALLACGRGNNSFVTQTANDSIGKQGITSYIYGLHLLNNNVRSSKYTAEEVVTELISLQHTDGGWSLGGDNSDIDITAMTLQALAPHYATDARVVQSVDAALDFLSTAQLETGGFVNYGAENPESAAQVLVALAALGILPNSDSRFIKGGHSLLDGMLKFRLDNGSFCHSEGGATNNTATAQALYSLVAVSRAMKGLSPLFVFDDTTPPLSESSVTESSEVIDSQSESSEIAYSAIESQSGSVTDTPQQGHTSYKVWACGAIAVLVALTCVILLVKKKRGFKHYTLPLLLGALAFAVILLTDITPTASYYGQDEQSKSNITGSVTISIRCGKLIGLADPKLIPADGVILPIETFNINDTDTVYSILIEAAKKHSIRIENDGVAGLVYISGIDSIYEGDFGDLSGWIYRVNGENPSEGCGTYLLSDGDVIEWIYTLEFGNDT